MFSALNSVHLSSYESNLSADASILFLKKTCFARLPHQYHWASRQFYNSSNPGCLFLWQQKTWKLNWATLICTFDLIPKVAQANWSGGKLPRVLSISLFSCRWSAGGLLFLLLVVVVRIFPKCLLETKLSWNKNWHSMPKRIIGKSHLPLAQHFKFSKRKF